VTKKLGIHGSFWALTVCLFVGVQAPIAAAQDIPPTRGTLVGANDGDLLDFECTEISTERLSCSFVQVFLRPKSTYEDFQDSLKTVPDIIQEVNAGSEFCRFVIAQDKLLSGQTIEDPVLREQIEIAIKETALARLKDQRSIEKYETVDIATLALCKSPSTETARKFLEASHDAGADICEPTFNRYVQPYVRVSAGLWVVESTPTGECGVINTSRFIADPKYPFLWSFEASKVVSNKAGQSIIPCSELDERPQPYRWNHGPVLKNCTFID
jgi:hypothetical protein